MGKMWSKKVFEERHADNMHVFNPKTIIVACFSTFDSPTEGHKMISKMRLYRDVGFALTHGFVYSQIFYPLYKGAIMGNLSLKILALSFLYLFVGGWVCKSVRGLILRANYEFNIKLFGREEDIPAQMVVAAILMSLKMYPAILIFVLPLLIWIAPEISISVNMVFAVIGAVATLVVRYIFESKGYVIEIPDMDAP